MATIDRRNNTVGQTDAPAATTPNAGLAIKTAVRVAATANINLQTFGLGVLDGVTLAAADRVLLTGQSDPTQNGIYSASTGVWQRASDAADNSQWANGAQVYVIFGTASGGTEFILSASDPVLLGTSALTFASGLGVGGILQISPVGGVATLRLGKIGAATSPYIDFEVSGLPSLYDARLIATGGSSVNGAGTLQLLGTFAITPVSGTLQQGLTIAQSSSGSVAQAGPFDYNSISIVDRSNITGDAGANANQAHGLSVALNTGGTNSGGTKTAFLASLFHADASNAASARDNVAATFRATSVASEGGTGTGPSTSKGTIFAASPTAALGSGATNYFSVSGAEVDVGIVTGASSYARLGWSIVGFGDLPAASLYDAAFEIGSESSGGSWKTGLMFSSLHGTQPIATTGTLIGTDAINFTAATGLDFSALTLANFLKGPGGFSVSGTAQIVGTTLALNTTINNGMTISDGTVSGALQPNGFFSHALQFGTVSAHNLVFISNNTLAGYFDTGQAFHLGTVGISQGLLSIHGLTTGVVSVAVQASTGTYNFNLPTAQGTSGQALLSAGGGSSPMTFGTLGAAAGGTGLATLTAHAVMLGEGTGNVGFATIGTAGRMLLDQGAGADPSFNAMSGDATLANTGALTLASTIAAGGPTGSATASPIITYDAKGRLTAVSSATITPAIGSITGLGTGVATALGINVGSAGAFVAFNGALGTPSSGTLTNATGLPTAGLTGTLQAAQEPAHTGDVTNSAGSLALAIANNAVTYAKFQQVAASSLVGNATGSLANAAGITLGATLAFSGSALQTAAHTGDITTTANSFATTLATVNSNVGTFGSATQSVQFTVNGKGLITAAANVTVTPAVGSITGLGTGVATALGVNVGSAGAVVTFGGALGSPSSVGTVPAYTLGGAISGAGNQINNVVIGTSSPQSGTFTGVNMTAASNLTLSQNGATIFTVSNTNAGAAGTAELDVTSNAGTFSAKAFSVAAGGVAQFIYTGAGMNFVNFNASASIAFQTGLSAATAISVDVSQQVFLPAAATTASGANAFFDAATTPANQLKRSTSSMRYKRDPEAFDVLIAKKLLSAAKPIWYRSAIADDRQDWSWYGLAAEDMAAIDPRFVHWGYRDEDREPVRVGGDDQSPTIEWRPKAGAMLVPDGVTYDRLTVPLLAIGQDHEARIAALEAARHAACS